MRKLFPYLRDYRLDCVLGPVLKLLEAALELAVPFFILKITNTGIAGGDRGYILTLMGILVAMGLAGLVFSVSAQYFCARAACGFGAKVREALYGKIFTLSFDRLDDMGASGIITRMTGDTDQVQNAVNLSLRLLLRAPVIVFGALVLAFTVNVKGALVFCVMIPLLAAVIFAVRLTTSPLHGKIRAELDGMTQITRENLSGTRVIRALCREKGENVRFSSAAGRLEKMQNRAGVISALLNPLTYVIVNLSIVALIFVGGRLSEKSLITAGEILALYNYMTQILFELVKLANLIITVTRGQVCGKRITAVLECRSTQEIAEDDREDGPFLRFDDVSFAYHKGSQPAVSHVSFSAEKGEKIGIIGGTGSGKTTVAALLCRFYDPDGGRITVRGRNVLSYDPDELRAGMGIVLQKAELFGGTVRSNVTYGAPDISDSELNAALETAQAAEFVSEMPLGPDSPVEQGGRNLSGGQRQRISVARALAKKSDILILDDSASALDYMTELKLRRGIAALDPAPAVIIISQRVSSVRGCDRILVLDEGRVCGLGTHDFLYGSCPEYREICDTQTRGAQA